MRRYLESPPKGLQKVFIGSLRQSIDACGCLSSSAGGELSAELIRALRILQRSAHADYIVPSAGRGEQGMGGCRCLPSQMIGEHAAHSSRPRGIGQPIEPMALIFPSGFYLFRSAQIRMESRPKLGKAVFFCDEIQGIFIGLQLAEKHIRRNV